MGFIFTPSLNAAVPEDLQPAKMRFELEYLGRGSTHHMGRIGGCSQGIWWAAELCGKVVVMSSLGLAPRVQGRAQDFSEGGGVAAVPKGHTRARRASPLGVRGHAPPGNF